MRKHIVLFAAALLPLVTSAQSTLTLQPNAIAGKDAAIFSCIPCGFHNQNFGSIEENYAIAWTKNSADHKIRSLIQFDLSAIPEGSTVISATLSLYWPPGSAEGNHFGFFGSNKAFLERIMNPWSESTVTWDSQPATSARIRIPIEGTTSISQNYSNINVKTLVQLMVDDPEHNFGFMLKLQSEAVYKKLVFASSDHPNAALRPKLTVRYSIPLAEVPVYEEMRTTPPAQVLKIYPNPAKDVVNITINSASDEPAYISVFDLNGREMMDQSYPLMEGKNQIRIETAAWTRGLYMVIVKTGGDMITERLLLK